MRSIKRDMLQFIESEPRINRSAQLFKTAPGKGASVDVKGRKILWRRPWAGVHGALSDPFSALESAIRTAAKPPCVSSISMRRPYRKKDGHTLLMAAPRWLCWNPHPCAHG
jgi:hypothetical protein